MITQQQALGHRRYRSNVWFHWGDDRMYFVYVDGPDGRQHQISNRDQTCVLCTRGRGTLWLPRTLVNQSPFGDIV